MKNIWIQKFFLICCTRRDCLWKIIRINKLRQQWREIQESFAHFRYTTATCVFWVRWCTNARAYVTGLQEEAECLKIAEVKYVLWKQSGFPVNNSETSPALPATATHKQMFKRFAQNVAQRQSCERVVLKDLNQRIQRTVTALVHGTLLIVTVS